jgi:hypothetical protein
VHLGVLVLGGLGPSPRAPPAAAARLRRHPPDPAAPRDDQRPQRVVAHREDV